MNSVPIYEDELLSFWLLRLSKANYTSFSSMMSYIFNIKQFHKRDLDLRDLTNTQREQLMAKTGLKNIEQHQLLRYEGYLVRYFSPGGRHTWITPINRLKFLKGNFRGIRFCPICLQFEPYIRDIWRITFINICPEHHCYLLNACQYCNSNMRYPNEQAYQAIHECYCCGQDLRSCSVEFVSTCSREWTTQEKLFQILKMGYFQLNARYYYSFMLFEILHIVTRNIINAKKYNILYLEEQSPQILSKLNAFAFSLLQQFPHRLNRFYRKYKFTNLHRILDKKRTNLQIIPEVFINNIYFNRKG